MKQQTIGNSDIGHWMMVHDVAANLKKGDWLASVDTSRFYLESKSVSRKEFEKRTVQDPDIYTHSGKLNNNNQERNKRMYLFFKHSTTFLMRE